MLLPKDAKDPKKTAAVIAFFKWSLEKGDKLAADLDYVALPKKLVSDIQAKAFGEIKTQ